MTLRTSIIILFVLLICATCFGQSSSRGSHPAGADVERVFGQPVRALSETL